MNYWWDTWAGEYSDEFNAFIENEVRPEVELVNWKRFQPPVEDEED